jgi:DNA-binding NarL/FixJ family response regulator
LTHVELGELDQAEAWLALAAEAAALDPTPLRARQLESTRGMIRAVAGDAQGMQEHLGRAVRLATEQGRPAARCEALARLALEAATLGAADGDPELLALADEAARDARELMDLLPGHPPWGAEADAALAQVALARGERETAADAARSAFATLHAAHSEDVFLRIVLPAARVLLLASDADDERQMVQELLTLRAALIAQRTADEDVRVRWFRGPLGRELSTLTGSSYGELRGQVTHPPKAAAVGEGDTRLLWLLIEGRTNREIASELEVDEEVVARRLAEMYARIGVSSRGEAAVLAFRERMV